MLLDKCLLQYDPKPIKGTSAAMDKPWWLIGFLQEGNELREYYNWFIEKRTGIKLMKPAWGAHISIVRGEEPINIDLWGKYQGKELEFSYGEFIKTNGSHWWLRIVCDQMNDIREELGLPRKHQIGLHLTIGTPIPVQQDLSEYYTRFLHKENIEF